MCMYVFVCELINKEENVCDTDRMRGAERGKSIY
jgi:hypothetical protein